MKPETSYFSFGPLDVHMEEWCDCIFSKIHRIVVRKAVYLRGKYRPNLKINQTNPDENVTMLILQMPFEKKISAHI